MIFDGMTMAEIRQVIADAEAELAVRVAVADAERAVVDAVAAYAGVAGCTVLQAWRALAPEGVTVPDDPPPPALPDAPRFVLPTGAHDAYAKGDRVTFEGAVYECLINACTWSPAAYPQAWKKVSA